MARNWHSHKSLTADKLVKLFFIVLTTGIRLFLNNYLWRRESCFKITVCLLLRIYIVKESTSFCFHFFFPVSSFSCKMEETWEAKLFSFDHKWFQKWAADRWQQPSHCWQDLWSATLICVNVPFHLFVFNPVRELKPSQQTSWALSTSFKRLPKCPHSIPTEPFPSWTWSEEKLFRPCAPGTLSCSFFLWCWCWASQEHTVSFFPKCDLCNQNFNNVCI